RRRSLSPLERVSSMIPEELLSQEVRDLMDARQGEQSHEDCSPRPFPQTFASAAGIAAEPPSLQNKPTRSARIKREVPFKPGDLVLAELWRKQTLEFRKMFSLTATGKALSNWGMVLHRDIVGKFPGQIFKTSTNFKLLMRRPSLEEYAMLMKRGPNITYPKQHGKIEDVNTLLMVMDINEGDYVLECGSGSGGMTLFLSRAVGSEGRVLSLEVRDDHHCRALKNYQRWCAAWAVAHEEEWPQNVEFIKKDITAVAEDMKAVTFDAVALDMINPQVALPVMHPLLKQGGVCAVYLANMTQIIDLLEGIRRCQLSLLCERVFEVMHRDWIVAPALRKDGSIVQRVEPQHNRSEESPDQRHGRLMDDEMPFGTMPYIARPRHGLSSHTGFLVKLRK
uniref:tRNA (adenine(58)-N(1))-methyltransferase n=1 Tax=Latimeria chalumnae TaxID=7897 RepID=H3AWF2_LATCH